MDKVELHRLVTMFRTPDYGKETHEGGGVKDLALVKVDLSNDKKMPNNQVYADLPHPFVSLNFGIRSSLYCCTALV